MRVVIFMSSLAMGGGERTVVGLLPALRDRGIEVTLCTMTRRRDSVLAADLARHRVRRVDLDASRLLDPRAWLRLSRLLRAERPNVLHCQDQYTNIIGCLSRPLHGLPVVMTRHVLEEPSEGLRTAARAFLAPFAARIAADRVVAVSDAVRGRFAVQARLPPERLLTIHNGIDLAPFRVSVERAAKRREMGWPDAAPIVTMVAVLRAGKGHEVLFRAVPLVRALVPGAVFKIVGGGPLLRQLVTQAGPLGDAVEFLGERGDVPELLHASDLLVLPSWSEALPTVLIEAGAASLPVVATDVGGAGEIVEMGRTGTLVPAGDVEALASAMVELLQDPARARAMGAAARERVTRSFSLEAQAEATARLYAEVAR